MSFDERVWKECKKIPKGKVSTYKRIAAALGNPNAFRAVGNALNRNPFAPEVPCHRVVKSSGELGEYAKGTKKKIELLEREGIKVQEKRVSGFGKALL